MEGDDPASCVRALERGIELGMTHIDTAELYGSGRVEKLLSPVLTGKRDRLFLVSKVQPDHASYDGTLRACEASLRRLGTDHLDCYLLHWPGAQPLADTIRAFEALKSQGKIRRWGVSNFDVPELEEALAIAGPKAIACNQVVYHLEERNIERRVIPWCEEHGVAVVGYSPFGAGRWISPRGDGARVLERIAQARGATARQVALRFLVRRPSLLTIPKAATVAHVEDNAAAARVELTPADLEAIDRAFPVRRARGFPML
jgi:diketogulonate reductase-like aldo/keto reductase